MAINGISGKSVACLLLYCMGRLDFAVDANVLRVMTRLGWLKHIGASPADALATCDRRVATEHGLLQAPRAPPRLPLPKRPYLASVGGEAMPKLPKMVYGATGSQRAAPTRPSSSNPNPNPNPNFNRNPNPNPNPNPKPNPKPTLTPNQAEFQLAQFDALNSLNARRSEVWVELVDHPWTDEV